MYEIRQEVMVFILALLAGGIVRLVYRVIVCVRRMIRHTRLAVEIEDLVYSRKVKLVNKIKSYIEETIADTQISINDIARHFYVSRQHMTRLFKEIEDINPMEYKTKIRIEQAKKQLSLSDSSIKEVAQTLGFSDVQYFHKSFKKYTGMTPLQYKQEYAVKAYPIDVSNAPSRDCHARAGGVFSHSFQTCSYSPMKSDNI